MGWRTAWNVWWCYTRRSIGLHPHAEAGSRSPLCYGPDPGCASRCCGQRSQQTGITNRFTRASCIAHSRITKTVAWVQRARPVWNQHGRKKSAARSSQDWCSSRYGIWNDCARCIRWWRWRTGAWLGYRSKSQELQWYWRLFLWQWL